MATQPQVTAGGPRQLVLVAALAGVLLLTVGLLVVRPLLGGTDEAQPAPTQATAGAAPTTTTPQLIAPSTSVTASGEAAGSVKDPFKPLVSAERQVALVSISGGAAKVTVDGTAYTVSEGESFASGYRAVDIGTGCASFESDTTAFTLCEGEAVLK
jgi:hypothetical protein